ncbi:MAG TPA: DUF481 domain-containing protein [Gemmatimonadales bacterium]|nr:DUF481 domain-containing protein [Gemmatimonadales bacterium]
MTLIRATAIATVVLGGAAASTAAQQTPAPPPPPATKLALDFGLVATSGNTKLTTTNFGEKFEWTPQSPWSLTEALTVIEGSQNDAKTVDQIKGQVQPRYNFSARVGAYALAGYERNRFAGLAWRWEEGVGVTVHAVKDAHNQLDFEAGGSFNQEQNYLVGAVERVDFGSTRTFGYYRYSFAEKSYAYQSLEWLANLKDGQDQRVNSETGLVAPVVAAVAIKVTYLIRYDHEPVPGYLTTDRTLTTGIQITF